MREALDDFRGLATYSYANAGWANHASLPCLFIDRAMGNAPAHRRVITLAIFLSVILLATSISMARSQQEENLVGKVVDAMTDKALDGSMVHIWGWVIGDGGGQDLYDVSLSTNETGHYYISLLITSYLLLARKQ